LKYIPRVLLCGSAKNFSDVLKGRAVEVVGKISFRGAAERGEFIMPANAEFANAYELKPGDFRIFLDGAEISVDNLRGLLDGSADYIVFDDDDAYLMRFRELYALKLIDRVITAQTLLRYATDGFFSLNNAIQIFNAIKQLDLPRTLDFDGYFAKNDYHMFPDVDSKISGIVAKVEYPALENFYAQIYPSLDACRLKHFDALLLTSERSPAEFIDALIDTDSFSENIFAFVRRGSALESWLAANENVFAEVKRFAAVNGNWILLKKFARADFCVYVVTHKDAKLSTLPEGYRIIHAGHATAKKNFGYAGDDTGDNISAFNRYLNEITALYWMWKNTRHTIIGLNHYRRFFTESDDSSFAVEKILSRTSAEKILRDCDMIVVTGDFFTLTQHELKTLICGDDLNSFVEKIFREHISRKQPDYLDAFDRVTGSRSEFMYEMFITRRKIFDAYCDWLFSFIIDVTDEVIARTNIAQIDNPRKYRVVGLIAERLLSVWLMQNRLRLKSLPILYRDDV